ncbi:MAG: hypothetical protein KGK11_02085 [Sphingomonadales bacterium]|nr:hypothetical protein [Sphingomonadales bacterium]
MGAAADSLTAHVDRGGGYDIPHAQIRDIQIAAIAERFAERRQRIRLLAHRADEAGITDVRELAEAVPLLFPHTAYKSYPESFLSEQRWDRLGKWLGTVSPYPIAPHAELTKHGPIAGIDDWIERLEAAGHYVSCSSGTTGKSAMLIGSAADMDFAGREAVLACAWGANVAPAQDRLVFGLAPIAQVPRNHAVGSALKEAFSLPGRERFSYPVPPITIGSITGMVAMRRKIADATASPAEIAEYEAVSAARAAAMDAAVGISARAVIEARHEKLYVSGMWAALYQVAAAVRALGYSGADFHPENTCYIGGGLKGAQLPPDYRSFVFETFNIAPGRVYQMYGMQEIISSMPRCQKGGRYHLPPWLVPLVLNEAGDALAGPHRGEIEGRAAFFDLALDGRWGGVISGDKVAISFDPCACGTAGPSVRDDIARYSELTAGDDKIACSGTVDAYVRGVV